MLRRYESTDVPEPQVVARRDYAFAGERLVGTEDPQNPGTSRMYATVDHLGTPRLWTDTSGQVLKKLKYYPFGKEATPSDQGPIALQFTGHERDANDFSQAGEDIDYMHARNELPGMGRFLSIDPAGARAALPQTWNRYSYALGSPTNFVDPTGRRVAVLSALALKLLRLSVPVDLRGFLAVNNNGLLSRAAINAVQTGDKNFLALRDLVNSPALVEVTTASRSESRSGSGERFFYTSVEDLIKESTPFIGGQRARAEITAPELYLGQFSTPEESPSGFPRVTLTDLSGTAASAPDREIATTVAEEVYGHMLLYMRHQPYRHDQGGQVDSFIRDVQTRTRNLFP